jgi:hypoxanthine phosphoribosyltransferase
MVVSDFMKQYTKPCEVSFIKMVYEGTSSTNEVKQPRTDDCSVVIRGYR